MSPNKDELAECFQYLDDLRESGETNMFGSSKYLEQDFGLSKKEATKIAVMWMTSFDGKKSLSERIQLALQDEK